MSTVYLEKDFFREKIFFEKINLTLKLNKKIDTIKNLQIILLIIRNMTATFFAPG